MTDEVFRDGRWQPAIPAVTAADVPPLAAEAREATFADWYQAHVQQEGCDQVTHGAWQAGWAARSDYNEQDCATAILNAVDAAVEVVAKLAERLAATVPVQGGTMPFADIIRHQQKAAGRDT